MVAWDGATLSAAAGSRAPLALFLVRYSWAVQARADGQLATGSVQIAARRGARLCRGRAPRTFVARLGTPSRASVAPGRRRPVLRGRAPARRAGGGRAPRSCASVPTDVASLHAGSPPHAAAGEGAQRPTNLTPPTRIGADGAFARRERFACATPMPPSAIAHRSAAGSPVRPPAAACGSGRPCSRAAPAASSRGATRAAAAGRPGAAASHRPRRPARPRPRRTRRRVQARRHPPPTRRSGPRPWSAAGHSTWTAIRASTSAKVRPGTTARRMASRSRSTSSRPGTSSNSRSRRATARVDRLVRDRRRQPAARRDLRDDGGVRLGVAGLRRPRSRLRALHRKFTITALAYDPNGALRTFTVNFEAHCEGLPEALRGSFAFQAA